jgi:methylglutaconyl-CoA hydratase
MSNETVLWQTDPRGVATVTLNRPEVNNAYDDALIQGLHDAMDSLGDARVVVLKGAGRHFQAGADLKWIRDVASKDQQENERASKATAMAVHRLNTLSVPTVALVQGGCFGGGTGIVAACDIVIAADNAMFSIAETRWGLTAAIILPQLADAIGARQVRRYALSGERFGAEEARRIGLVHDVVPVAGLEAAGAKMVEQLLQNAPRANAETKATALRFAWGVTELEDLIMAHAAKRRSDEAAEGLASFAEKRAARWRGAI